MEKCHANVFHGRRRAVLDLALAVLWIFAESGGALTVIAAGVFAIVAIVALGCERILKTLEEIRDRACSAFAVTTARVAGREMHARLSAIGLLCGYRISSLATAFPRR